MLIPADDLGWNDLTFANGMAPHERLFWRQGHGRVAIADGWKLQRSARPSLIEAPISIDKTLREPPSPDDEYIYWPN